MWRLFMSENPYRLAKDIRGIDRLGELVEQVLGVPEVDSAIDCVGFEAKAQKAGKPVDAPAVVLNSEMEIIRSAGSIGIPGLYVTDDPGAKDEAAKRGSLSLRFGLGWAKSNSFHTGQTPVLRYNRQLMEAILWDRLPIAKAVNVKVISLDQAPEGYKEFDAGAPRKFVLDPHGMLASATSMHSIRFEFYCSAVTTLTRVTSSPRQSE